MTADAVKYPVVERIAQLLHARLEGLKGPTYNTRASAVVRSADQFKAQSDGELTGSFTIADRLILLSFGSSEQIAIEYGNPAVVVRAQLFEVTAYLAPHDRDQTPLDAIKAIFAADIQKAITTPEDAADDWAQFGELARYSDIGPPADVENPNWFEFSIPLVVTYATSETDPYQVR